MSRRKQAKPQPVRPGEEAGRGDPRRRARDAAEGPDGEDGEEPHVCEKCCAEFFSWSDLSEHRGVCTEDPMVLIVKESGGVPAAEDSPAGPSPAPSAASSDSSAAESTDGSPEPGDEDSLEILEDGRGGDEDKAGPPPPDPTLPSTNVTLEILHSTRVAVAQFSQGVAGGAGGGAGGAAVPLILQHLLALQQQQLQQLQLIQQICSQVAVMTPPPTSRPLSLAPTPGINPPHILPLSGAMPSSLSGQAAVSLSQSLPPQTICGQSACRDASCPSASPEKANPSLPSSSSMSTLLPPYTGSLCSSTPSGLLGSSSNLPFLPQSPPSSVIFPNPLASIAATTSALDPLAKHRKVLEAKASPEEPFFKHKCRFCAKVFGSDSALQIHLRSHTGERPFKCNICGNRFSTKGNLKVHFQRHKDKYPHVQMNPFPVPEYLDSVPTSSGIPYGMSIPPEKPVSSWLDGKPGGVAALPASLALPLPPTAASMGGSGDPVSVTASVKSPYQAAPAECVSVSPRHRGSEAAFSPQSNWETEASRMLNTEGGHLPQSCPLRPEAATPEPKPPASPVSSSPGDLRPPPGPEDSLQASETSKLQQLVENIDRKMADPHQCTLCRRVLSCPSALKMHHRIHTGERPFPCKVCGRAFSTRGNLKTHVGVHRETPPLQVQHSCPLCQKKFTNAVVLQQHIRVHMGGRSPEPAGVGALRGLRGLDGDNLDSLSSNDNELTDDISMEEEEEDDEGGGEEEVENSEEGVNGFTPFTPDCNSPLQSPAAVSSLAALEKQMWRMDPRFAVKPLTNGCRDGSQLSPHGEQKPENFRENSPPVSQSFPEAPAAISIDQPDYQEPRAASVKREEPESPTSVPPSELCVKEESLYGVAFLPSREPAAGQIIAGLISSFSSGANNGEMNGHSQPNAATEGQPPPFSIHMAAAYPAACSPGATSLLGPAPPRRTPKQHNCHACGKNFSSASALQIHERTHTGEKPFVCSICGRAFTTKGNLKVHMGTHMWNNAPARRGRRLSVENPMALLGGEAVKFGEMFQKDLAARAMNVDAGFWNRYAAAISNSLAMKNNEISVIQNRGLAPLHPLSAGVDRVGAAAGLTKTAMDLGSSRHFSMLIDDSKEIGIN